jgi:hypothetical protein
MANILADLDAAFEADNDINELGIILDTPPPAVVLMEHKLGIAAPALKPLLKYCLQEYYALGCGATLRFDDGTQVGRNDDDNVNDHVGDNMGEHVPDPDLVRKLLSLSRAILCIRGNFPLAFSLRKTLLTHRVISFVDELRFLNLLFTKHPKCPASWEHRRWCLVQQSKGLSSESVLPVETLKLELELCTAMAESYPKNYYAWVHRLWLLGHMSIDFLKNELQFTKTWLLRHVSDHCASNHRIQVTVRILRIQQVYTCRSDEEEESENHHKPLVERLYDGYHEKAVLVSELLLESEVLLQSRPGSETLWYHRRDLIEVFLDLLFPSPSSHEHLSIEDTANVVFNLETLRRSILITVDPGRLNTSILSDLSIGSPKPTKKGDDIDDEGGIVVNMDAQWKLIALLNVWDSIASQVLGNLSNRDANDNQKKSMNELRLDLLIIWIRYEVALCRVCAEEPCQWNSELQRSYAVRYLVALLIGVSSPLQHRSPFSPQLCSSRFEFIVDR